MLDEKIKEALLKKAVGFESDEIIEEYVSDAITDETGFCHNGFYLKQFSKPVGRR